MMMREPDTRRWRASELKAPLLFAVTGIMIRRRVWIARVVGRAAAGYGRRRRISRGL
jgi:hypothetical protein